MKISLIIFHILLCTKMLCAQQVLVIDQSSNLPMELVRITDGRQSNKIIFTDAKGRADISALLPLAHDSLYFSTFGYSTLAVSFKSLQQNNFKVELTQTEISLNEVVISANRWEQDKKDVPNKISTIRQSDIVFQNPQTAADLLSAGGEVYVQKSQLGGGSPMIRGFATNRVLIAVDGVRLNNAIFRSGNLQNVISLDAFATEKTEVIFGPGSVMYGSDAIGGVMSFYTLTPKFATEKGKPFFKGSAVTRFASANNEKTAHLDFNIGLRKWSFLTSISYSDFDDLRMGKNGPDDYLRPEYATQIDGKDIVLRNKDPLVQVNSGYSQVNFMQKIRFKPNENWDLTYGLHYSASTDVPRYDRLIEYRNGKLRDAEWYYGPQTWLLNTLNATYTKKSIFSDGINITLSNQNFGESRHNRSFGDNIRSHRTESVNVSSANIDVEKNLDEKQQLFYGVEILANTIGSFGEDEDIETGQFRSASTRYPNGSTWNSYAAYITHQWKESPKTTVQTGLRYNFINLHAEFDTTFFPLPFQSANINTGALNGSFGIVNKLSHGWFFTTNLSTGFRAPNMDDVGKVFDSEPGSVVIPNPGLKPEYAVNGEISVEKVLDKALRTSITAYYTILNNALVRRNYTLNGLDSIMYDGQRSQVQAIQNAARAEVYGIQAALDIKFPLGFGFTSRFNYQQGKEELDNGSTSPLRHAAPWFGTSHITYSHKMLKADFYTVYNGKVSNKDLALSEQDKPTYAKDENGNAYTPAWYTLNFKASLKVTRFLMLNAGIENITDIRYRPYSAGITAPGRNFIISARATF